jgi:hypothetical protein
MRRDPDRLPPWPTIPGAIAWLARRGVYVSEAHMRDRRRGPCRQRRYDQDGVPCVSRAEVERYFTNPPERGRPGTPVLDPPARGRPRKKGGSK